jgi:hypothetical protein
MNRNLVFSDAITAMKDIFLKKPSGRCEIIVEKNQEVLRTLKCDARRHVDGH